MKSKLLMFIATLLASTSASLVQAQTDVTDQYLKNAGFETEPVTFVNNAKNTNAQRIGTNGWIYTIPNWTNASIVANNAVQVASAMYGTTTSSSEGLNSTTPPTTGINSTPGACLHMSAGWGDDAIVTQEVTLPEGTYELSYEAYNAHTTAAIAENFFGYIPFTGSPVYGSKKSFATNTWESETIAFNVMGDGQIGKISLGCTTSAGGSGNGAKLYIDNVKLVYLGIDKTDLDNTITEAENLYSSEGIGADAFNTAINAAKTVSNNSGSTMAEVTTAIADLISATRVYGIENSSLTNPFEVTYLIKNAEIADGTDWTGSRTGSGEQYMNAPDNTYLDAGWNTASFDMHQILPNIPNGIYHLKAAGRSNVTSTYIYADSYKTDIPQTGNTGNTLGNGWEWVLIENIVVNTNTLQIGFKGGTPGQTWAGVDDFKLLYYGFDKTTALATLATLIETAEGLTTPMQASISETLKNAVTAAKGTTTSSTRAEIETTTANLENAISAATTSIAEYAKLQTAIDAAHTYLTEITTPSQDAKNTFQAAITTAQEVISNGSVTTTATAIATLEAARLAYLMTQPSPADLTMLLVNPSFESGDETGWEFTQNSTDGYTSGASTDATTTDGNYNFYYSITGRMRHVNVSQNVILPAGTYTIEADVKGNPIPEKKTYLYVTTGSVNHWADGASYNNDLVVFDSYVVTSPLENSEQWETLKATFTISAESTVRFGILSWGYNAASDTEKRGAFKADNFRLAYRGEGAIDIHNTTATVKGTVDLEELTAALAQEITSVDFTEATLAGDEHITAQNPNTIAYGLSNGISFNGIDANGGTAMLNENFAFNAPTGFNAQVSFKRSTFNGTVNHTVLGGWQTLCLPFDVDMQEITCNDGGSNLIPVKSFTGAESGLRPFWLYRADEAAASGFEPATTILANVPYLVLFPNDDSAEGYEDYFNIDGTITFTGTAVEKTEVKSENAGSNYFLNSNFAPLTDAAKYGLDADGANFVSGATVNAFSAYASQPTSTGAKVLPIFGGTTGLPEGITLDNQKNLLVYAAGNGIVGILSPKACKVAVYTLDGTPFGTYDVAEGTNEISLPAHENGTYIINGQVVIVY